MKQCEILAKPNRQAERGRDGRSTVREEGERDRLFSMGTASGAVSTLSPSAARRAARTRRRGAATDAERARWGRGRGRARARATGTAGAARQTAADLGTAAASIARGAAAGGRARVGSGGEARAGGGDGDRNEEARFCGGFGLFWELRFRSLACLLWDVRLLGFCHVILSVAMKNIVLLQFSIDRRDFMIICLV